MKKTIQWILAVVLGLATLGAFMESVISGIFMLFATVLTCPLTRGKLISFVDAKLGVRSPFSKIKGWMYGVITFLLVVIATSLVPSEEGTPIEIVNNLEKTETTFEQEEKIEPTPTMTPISSPTPAPTPAPTAEPTLEPTVAPEPTPIPQQMEQNAYDGNDNASYDYAVNNKNGKIHMVGQCPATGTGKNAMEEPVYFNSFNEAEAYSANIESDPNKRKCGNCW